MLKKVHNKISKLCFRSGVREPSDIKNLDLKVNALRENLDVRNLKGHGNEADFLGFLQKLVPHRYLTLLFEPFRFWLHICGDIHNRKTTPRLAESGSRQLSGLASRGVDDSASRRVGF